MTRTGNRGKRDADHQCVECAVKAALCVLHCVYCTVLYTDYKPHLFSLLLSTQTVRRQDSDGCFNRPYLNDLLQKPPSVSDTATRKCVARCLKAAYL
jgi:hypothetical protein|eukprot:COSAG06_NODE_1886_length_8141_cov_76.884709_3_plen_97_part_00